MVSFGQCPQHPSEPVRLLCVPCRQRICVDCKISLHEGHRPTLKLVEAPTKALSCSSSASFFLEPNCSRSASAAGARAGATLTPTRKLEKGEGPSHASPKTFLGGLLHSVDCKFKKIQAVMTKSREKSPSTDKVCPRCEISPPLPPRRHPSCPESCPRQQRRRRQALMPYLTIAAPTQDGEHIYLQLLDDVRQAPTPSLSIDPPPTADTKDDKVDEDEEDYENHYLEVLGQGQGQDAVYVDALSARTAAQGHPLHQNYPDVFSDD